VCRYNWHSAGSLGWPFPMININIFFQIKRTLQFVCDVVKDTGKEEYLRQFIHIGLDWKQFFSNSTRKLIRGLKLPES